MAFDIYTDDGQLHRNVPKIQAYKDQQKTQVADFIASNDVPAEPTGTVNITANGTHNVAGKKYAAVNVPGIVPEGSLQITSNGTHDVTNYKYVVANIPSGGNVSITATYSGGSVEAGTSFNSLKSNLAVKMVLPDSSQISVASSDYTLAGTTPAIVEGSNTITVSYGGMTTSFTVTGTAAAPTLVGLEATYNNTTPVAAGTTLSQLNETVKAVYSDGSKSANLTEGTHYQLSGTLTAGQTNTVTVTGLGDYAGLSTTFNVTVQQEASGILMLNGFQTSTSKQGDKIYIVLEEGQQLPSTINKVTMKVVNKTSTPYTNNAAIHYARLLRSPTDGKLYPYYIEDYDPDGGTTSVVAMPANPEVVADQRASHASETIPDAVEWGADLTGNPIIVFFLYSLRRSGTGSWSSETNNYFAGQQNDPVTYKVSYDITFYADADAEEVHLHD